jgi:hypothetical protein
LHLHNANPNHFADVNSRVFLEVDQHQHDNASAIAAGFCQVQDQIVRLFSDISNICPGGQDDPLPFPCEQNPMLILLLFQGDNLLQNQLLADGDQNHQYLSIVRVVFQASEVLCHGSNYGHHQVMRAAAPFHQNFQQPQQQPQFPYAPQQAYAHSAPQPPPPPPQQQQRQQLPQQQQPPQQQQQQQPPQQQQQQVPVAPPPPLPPQQQQQYVANGLNAAEVQRRARATFCAQQQSPGGSNGP